jgi:hypothetical protein
VSPAISYGSITNYEYQLPAGWSIGSTTSTGSNWIAGGNNVTVTSDLGTGDGLFVKIRPVNTACGTGLKPGPTKLIAISRPEPTLAIPETQTDICSGSVNYTLTGLPAGATTVWSITNNNSVARVSNATNNSVTVNKISANRGVEILTATVTHCSYTYTETKTLNFGSPVSSFQIQNYLPLEVSCYETQAFYIFKPALILGNYTASYQWSYRVNGTTSETIIPASSEDGVFIFDFPGTYDILVRSVNSCGLGEPSMITITVVDFCYGFRMAVYPNPASGEINVSIDEESEELKKIPKTEKLTYQLVDIKNSNIVKSWSLDNTNTKQKLDVTDVKPDQYILIVTKGKYKKAMKVIIN